MESTMTLRNKVFTAIEARGERRTFDHYPYVRTNKNKALTRVLEEFEAEGLVSIQRIERLRGETWEVTRLWK
jgi:hypothetical protein